MIPGLLYRIAALIAPSAHRDWIDAIRAEGEAIPSGPAQLRWALGGLTAALRANLRDGGGLLVLVAVALGLVASYVDVNSSSRLMLRLWVIGSAFTLSLFGFRRAMLAIPALVTARALLIVCLGFPEPYAIDRMDVLYCVAPACVGTCMGLGLRSLVSRKKGAS
jgi:hypothetical protein